MKIRFFILTIILTLSLAPDSAMAAERSLVIVTGKNSRIEKISRKEVRKCFLGRPVTNSNNGKRIVPVRNISDMLLQEVFLQKVLFMSERSYERNLLSRAFRLGGSRPKKMNSHEKVVSVLNKSPNSISYMWGNEANSDPNVKVVIKLWDGLVE